MPALLTTAGQWRKHNVHIHAASGSFHVRVQKRTVCSLTMRIWVFGNGSGLFRELCCWRRAVRVNLPQIQMRKCLSLLTPSKFYTSALAGSPWIDSCVFVCQVCVCGGCMFIKEKQRGFDPELTGFLDRQTWQFLWAGECLFKCFKSNQIWNYCESWFNYGTHNRISTKYTLSGPIITSCVTKQ